MSDHRTRTFGPYKAVYKPQGYWSVSLFEDEIGGFSPLSGNPSDVFLNFIKDFENRVKCSYLPRKRVPIPREFHPLDFDEDWNRTHPPTPWTACAEIIDCVLEVDGEIAANGVQP